MAELYEKPKLYANAPAGVTPISGDPDLDKVLAELPPEEREEAMRKITAPPTGEEIARAMMEKNSNGEMFNMSLEQYRLLKAHNKNKEVDIISTFGQAAGGIYDELMKAAESVTNNPADALAKVTPSLIEAFAQGTRNLYGMAAQSADPTSVMFRMKNALSANGSDEEAEYRQFMEAQQFNIHSMNLMSGKETLIMDKDVINPEMTQVMSYVADPTLFVPFGGIAAKGARIIGMGEGLAKASARASAIRNKVLGGTLKWGVGAPIEFLGNATRNTIDYGLERSATAFEFATGMPAAEAQATARMYGLNSVAGSLAGQTVPLPIVGNVAGAMVGATTAQGVGEAIGMLGEQMIKQQKHGRGVLSYAGQALRDSEKAGVQLSAHAKGLLRVIDMADPLFVYGADIAEGAGTGMVIGGGLGYLAGGEEGMASGAGAGFALGAVGAGLGSVTADVTNNRLYDRIAIQRKMVIEGLKGTDDAKASAFEGYVKAAEATGDRRYMAEVDGMIAGIDLMSPNSKWNIRTEAEHTAWLKSLKIDPKTGRLVEETAILPQFGSDRKQRASALSFLSMVSDNFSGLPENLLQHIDTLPADHAMRKHWARLSDDVKQAVLAEVKQSGDIEYRKKFGSKKSNQYYGDINYAEAHTARINSLFDSGNPTQARERINMLLKEETVGGKLTERGKALKDKLATEGYFDKDGNMRPSRLKDVELTENEYRNVAGFVLRRDSTGQVEVNLNINNMGKVTGLHELFHAIMLDSPMKDEFIDRLSTKLLGKFDANGKRIEGASVDTNQVKKFFQRYIDSLHRNNAQERANETKRLERAIEEYEQRGDQNKVNRTTSTTLEELVEEFGAYYFPKFIQDKPVDYLFRGGELGAMREMLQSVKFGWLDFWRSKIGSANPDLNFDAIQGYNISQAFGKDGQPRYKNKALDLFMGDFVKATAMANRNGNFDLSRLSPEGQKTFIKNNGIRGYGTIDKDGKLVRLNRRTALREEMRVGKEIYKIVAGLDPKLRQGLTLDGEGNFSGRVSPELADALVASGHVDRAWVDKLLRAYDVIDGKESNVIEFGYLGRTAQIGDYAWPRLVGADVPFKNRTAILLDVDFKIGKDGRMSALYHTLDHAVIEGRANAIWSDPAIRSLWDGSRTAMEADFFRYLSNASLPSDHPERVTSMKLLEDGTGKGAMRRNALHQMLGMAKLDGDVYLNKPIAEIPLGIRHSVTTFNIDGVSGMRVRQGARYDYNHRNAFRDLSRNFMPSELTSEKTANGEVLKHASGFKFLKKNGSVTAYTSAGRKIGTYDNIESATTSAKNEYSKVYDNIDKGTQESVAEQNKLATRFQPLEESERLEAIRLGDVFALPSMKAFVGDRTLLRQTREEHIFQRAFEAVENPEQLLALAEQISQRNLQIDAEYKRLEKEWNNRADKYENYKDSIARVHYKKMNELRDKHSVPSSFEDWKFLQESEGKWNPPSKFLDNGFELNPEYKAYNLDAFAKYEADSKVAYSKFFADPEYIAQMESFNVHQEQFKKTAKELIDEEEALSDFRKKNHEALNDPILEELNSALYENESREEKARMFAGIVEATASQKDYSGLLEAMFGAEYDDQIQIGKPFVAVTTHGTGAVELMLSRLFAADKLGTVYDIPSSRMGSFSAGSQNTSKAYAKFAPRTDISPAGRFKRLTSFLNDEGMTDKTTEGYKLTSDFINKFRDSLLKRGYEESFVDILYRSFLHTSELDAINLEIEGFPKEVKDAWKKVVDKDNETIPANVPSKEQMQLRKVIRMDNPYVVVDPRSYEEHYISPHMKRAIEAGHDGIIFKRFADGGQRDNVYVVFKDFMKDNIKVIDTSFDDQGVPRGADETGRKLLGGKELKLKFQPTEDDMYRGGRTYNQNSKKWKSGFIGLWASENPDRLKGYNIEFFQKEAGAYRIRLQDNSVKGRTVDVGHITAVVSGDTATISSKIADEYQGNKLSYALYSEMAERLRAMGIRRVDGQIVNRDGVPIRVRERIIGDTRDYFSGKPIDQIEGAIRIREKQEQFGNMAGVDVYNRLDPNARYMPSEDIGSPQNVTEVHEWLNEVRNKGGDYTAVPMSESIKQTFGNLEAFKKARKEDMLTALEKAMQYGSQQAKDLLESVKSGKTPIKDAVDWIKKNGDFYTYNAELKDIRDERANLAKAVLRAMGEMRKISDKDGRRYNTEGEREHRNTMRQMPEEGGRTYTQRQMDGEFIGRFASENPKATKGLKPKFNIFSSGDEGNIELVRGQDTLGYINFSFSKATGDALIEYTRVADKHQGKGYGNLLYSELVERLRSMGIKEVQGMIVDERGRPQKIRERIIDKENARIGGDKTQIDYVEKDPDSDATQTGVTSYLYNKAWYMPAEGEKIGTQSSNVQLLLEGMASGRILRTSSYKGLGLEDAYLIAHTPDTAKIGQVTAGDKALADLQGGIFYAIANGKKIWASNFAGEGETNILVKFANKALKTNKDGKTYIMLVKADNSKIFASVDGARGVSSIFKHLNDAGVMSDTKYLKALRESAKKHLKLQNIDGLGKEELFTLIDSTILNSEDNKISFERRAKFSREIATQLVKSKAFDSEKNRQALQNSFHFGFNRGFSKVEMERVFGNLMAEDIIKDVPLGHVYGAIEIVSPLFETKESNHRGYNASIEQTSGDPARLIIFDKTAHAVEVLNKKSGQPIKKADPTRHLKDSEGNYVYQKDDAGELILSKKGKPKRVVEYEGEGSYISYTGGNIPYQEVKGKSRMPFQPAEGEQDGNKGRYDIDEAIVEKLKEKFKGYRNLTAKDMLEFIVENKGQFSPLAERLLESLDKQGLEAFVQQQTSTLGRTQKGTKGWTYHNYNPNNNTVNMLLERNVQRRRGWTLSFEELMMEEILHAVSFEKVPEPIKHGVTIEDTSKTVDHFLRNKEKYSSRYDDVWKTELGYSQEWFTIADAYKQVLKQFESGKFLDGTVMDKTAKHNISYRLSNMAEFIVGITQDKDVQTILSQIKVPKSEKSLLTKLLDAIKKIWNFDDSVVDSLLAVTSDAAEKVIQREKTQMEKVGTGIFRDRAKQFFGGMPEPKFQPAEGWRDWQSERTSVGSVIKNTAGYVIMVQKGKFKVYNPYKAIVGIYDSEEQAKRRVQKDEPRR